MPQLIRIVYKLMQFVPELIQIVDKQIQFMPELNQIVDKQTGKNREWHSVYQPFNNYHCHRNSVVYSVLNPAIK